MWRIQTFACEFLELRKKEKKIFSSPTAQGTNFTLSKKRASSATIRKAVCVCMCVCVCAHAHTRACKCCHIYEWDQYSILRPIQLIKGSQRDSCLCKVFFLKKIIITDKQGCMPVVSFLWMGTCHSEKEIVCCGCFKKSACGGSLFGNLTWKVQMNNHNILYH